MNNLTTLPIADGKYILKTYDNANGKPCATLETKRGKKVFNYYFKTAEIRDKYAVTRCEEIEQSEMKAVEQAAKNKLEQEAKIKALKVGDIFYTSWGWEQTNIEFYQIVKISGKRIYVKETSQNRKETGFMCGDCTSTGEILKNAEEIILGVTKYGGFRINGHYADIWDGRTKYYSYYA